jgi:5-methylcytosine-specific restriction protein B
MKSIASVRSVRDGDPRLSDRGGAPPAPPRLELQAFHYFVDQPDNGERTFEEKLKNQLIDASAEANQLAAEMLWVMMLFPSNIKQNTKVVLVRRVWEWSGRPLADPRGALEAMTHGIGSGGPGYNNYRPAELQLLV